MTYLGSTPQTQSFISGTDYFNGDGSTVAFTLSRSVGSVNDIEVLVNNVEQQPNTVYTVLGTTLTFTTAPSSGTQNIYVRYLSTTTQAIAPSQGSVGSSQLQTNLTLTGTTTASTITSAAATALTLQSAGTTAITVDASGNVGIGTASPSTKLTVAGNTLINGGAGNTLELNKAGGAALVFSYAGGLYDGLIQGLGTGGLNFYTGNTLTERMRINSSGTLLIGQTSLIQTEKFGVAYNSGSGTGINTNNTAGGGSTALQFFTSGLPYGSITTSSAGTAYNTSSDYRLKENIAPMTGALAKVSELKPVTYNWKLDGAQGEGFIAHELAEVCPLAVNGEKDAVDAEGKPVHQGIDTSFLVATLTAAIQEQQALIRDLTTRLSALEAK